MKAKQKVGRPESGRKPYCIRMTPQAKSALTKDATAAGYARLGDWLESLANPDAPRNTLDLNGMSPAELIDAFRGASKRAAAALAVLCEVIDYAPVPDKGGLRAFQAVKDQFQKVAHLAHSVGIVNR
jgi:hypothetical protein